MNQYAQPLWDAARRYSTLGWVAMPLRLDANDLPKRPFIDNWQNLTLPWEGNLSDLPWDKAVGLGLLLGPASSGLAVIDVDDEELAREIFPLCESTRCVSTVRNRGHIYYIESNPSRSKKFTVLYNGRSVTIELKTTGTQVAAPPTPGYSRIGPHTGQPQRVDSIDNAWNSIAQRLGITQGASVPNTRYRGVWEPAVSASHRNDTMFREAHFLREAGMPLEAALRLLRLRWEADYEQGGQDWEEIQNTIRSAYRKGTPYTPIEGGQDEIGLLRN